ncbi:HNH endonuclease signature motif containing protein [Streptomyces sp. H27-D2]|uniref:HNH endonuclease signature motif containing protein n=1 Tax=Streptomyces sp. H27-D2 TaxID=3046304 RepID=UPI003FA7CA6A
MSRNVEAIQFRGITFRRYPNAKGWSERSYYTSGGTDRANGVRRLHEEIWMAHHHRSIPSGSHIHHRDGNPLNNTPANLECLTEAEHGNHHAHARRGSCTPESYANLERIRPLASAWHRSEAGREWHSEHGRKVWASLAPLPHTCEQCSERYETRSRRGGERFCSGACRAAWRRASGVDDEDRSCERCGASFRVNKYHRTRFCGKSCSRRNSIAERRAGLESVGR